MLFYYNFLPNSLSEIEIINMVKQTSVSVDLFKKVQNYHVIRNNYRNLINIIKNNIKSNVKNNNYKLLEELIIVKTDLFKEQILFLELLKNNLNIYNITIKYNSIISGDIIISSDKFTTIIIDIIFTRYSFTYSLIYLLKDELENNIKEFSFQNNNKSLTNIISIKNKLKENFKVIRELYLASNDIWLYLNNLNISIPELKYQFLYYNFKLIEVSFYTLEILIRVFSNNLEINYLSNTLGLIQYNIKNIDALIEFEINNGQYYHLIEKYNHKFSNNLKNINNVFICYIIMKLVKLKSKTDAIYTKDKAIIYYLIYDLVKKSVEDGNITNTNYPFEISNKLFTNKDKEKLSKKSKFYVNYKNELTSSYYYNKNISDIINLFKLENEEYKLIFTN